MFFWLGFGNNEARWIGDGKVRTVRLGFGNGDECKGSSTICSGDGEEGWFFFLVTEMAIEMFYGSWFFFFGVLGIEIRLISL